ncbi:MAG: response regulator [Chloroflexota bacterium]|nr:MAG: response regulator [Chloroflexota bacterium]
MNGDTDRCVLVVEDEPDMALLVTTILEDSGYRVLAAGDGRQGLAVLECAHPDLILLDMKMPVMNGWEFAKALHERYKNHPPVVVFTAAENAARTASEIGADGFIGKPFDLDQFISYIGRFFDDSSHAAVNLQ